MLKSATDNSFNYHAGSASDNPHILSGELAHGGVALLWKYSLDDFICPIDNIESDRIVGIKCEFNGCRPLFILSVYLPASNYSIEDYREWIFFGLCMTHCLPVDSLLSWETLTAI